MKKNKQKDSFFSYKTLIDFLKFTFKWSIIIGLVVGAFIFYCFLFYERPVIQKEINLEKAFEIAETGDILVFSDYFLSYILGYWRNSPFTHSTLLMKLNDKLIGYEYGHLYGESGLIIRDMKKWFIEDKHKKPSKFYLLKYNGDKEISNDEMLKNILKHHSLKPNFYLDVFDLLKIWQNMNSPIEDSYYCSEFMAEVMKDCGTLDEKVITYNTDPSIFYKSKNWNELYKIV